MYRYLVDWWEMKVHSIQYDNSLKQGYHSDYPVSKEREYSAGLRGKENRGYSVAFSGSGASKSKAAAKVFNNLGETFTDKIFRSDKFKKLVEIFEEKTVVAQALVALAVAGVLRPATNMAMAGKEDREDSMYAAAHAISSAVIGFVVSSIVMAPFDKAFKKIKAEPAKYLGARTVIGKDGKTKKQLESLAELFDVADIGKRKLEKSKPYKNISKVAQMIPDSIVLGIPKAMLTIAMIPAILKYVFGLEKKSSKDTPVKANVNNEFLKNLIPVSISKFTGGDK